jgi:hypothetical protein
MLHIRGGPSATRLPDGRVLIAAGFTDDPWGPTTTTELFDPESGKSQTTGESKTPRYRHADVALPDGRVVLLGGYGHGNQALRSIEIYDPQAGTFTAHGELVEGRANLTAHLLPDGRILVVGGQFTDSSGNIIGARKSVEIYDPDTGQSTITDALAIDRGLHAAAALADGRILVAGGRQGPLGSQRAADLVDPTTGKVSPTVPLSTPRASPAAVTLQDGRVLIIGGFLTDGTTLNTAEVFVPAIASSPDPG